jgi:Na+/H+-translocating membrane pyrophosphatase
MLGAEALAGFLMFSTVSGILMALFLDNVGGAWDNAKKVTDIISCNSVYYLCE